MSATADALKLQDYFGDYYGHPYNRHVTAPLVTVEKPSNYTILTHYLDDLYGLIPAVSINMWLQYKYYQNTNNYKNYLVCLT